ncbi:hypothetical protein ACIRU8_15470 [Streptomyces sp. NPDC101175]|uniref:hypothetical protein n=1 Tax=Streptomyces sp. NPDC101175 TaxID=3366123 RepID=UPI00383434A4
MRTRGRRLRFTAVLALTVLTLTGFSTGRHHSGSRHRSGGGGGGGCSSSSQDHDTSTHRRSAYRSSPHSTASSASAGLRDGTARLVSCATAQRRYASVEVANPNSGRAVFSVRVTFLDARGDELDQGRASVRVPAGGRATVRVPVRATTAPVDHCEADSEASVTT